MKNTLFKYIKVMLICYFITYLILLILYNFNNSSKNKFEESKNQRKYLLNSEYLQLINENIIKKQYFKQISQNLKLKLIKENGGYKIYIKNYIDNCNSLDDIYLIENKNRNSYTLNVYSNTKNYIKNKIVSCQKDITINIINVIKENDIIYVVINGNIIKLGEKK